MEIFHGGCHGCINQAIKGIGYCDGCTYRRSGRRDLPNLYRSQDDLLELKKLYEQIFGDNSNRLEPPVKPATDAIKIIDEMIEPLREIQTDIECRTTNRDYNWWDAEMQIKSLTELKNRLSV